MAEAKIKTLNRSINKIGRANIDNIDIDLLEFANDRLVVLTVQQKKTCCMSKPRLQFYKHMKGI